MASLHFGHTEMIYKCQDGKQTWYLAYDLSQVGVLNFKS
jgi:hypothetical protein